MTGKVKKRRRKSEVAAGAVPADALGSEFPKLELSLQPPYPPMEAKQIDSVPTGEGWQYEPKWDGFRCLAFRDHDQVVLQSKAGQPLGRYFPELVSELLKLKASSFVLDGEIVIWRDGHLSFDDLLMRIHPAASRIAKLSKETPSMLLIFDLLVGSNRLLLVSHPLIEMIERRALLEDFFANVPANSSIRLSPASRNSEAAKRWMSDCTTGFDGVVVKQVDAPYESGSRAMLKVKRMRTADCVVGGFRYASKGGEVGSLLLGLYDENRKLNHVGFTSSFNHDERRKLQAVLKPHMNGNGFSGNAPGGPSRWSTERSGQWEPLDPKLVCEVRFDHFSGGRFRHGTKFLRWRPEKKPASCTYEQLRHESVGTIDDLLAA